ncbi:hypothetical protein AB0E88_23010 [Streptomyces sp. NPDC028635]
MPGERPQACEIVETTGAAGVFRTPAGHPNGYTSDSGTSALPGTRP